MLRKELSRHLSIGCNLLTINEISFQIKELLEASVQNQIQYRLHQKYCWQ